MAYATKLDRKVKKDIKYLFKLLHFNEMQAVYKRYRTGIR